MESLQKFLTQKRKSVNAVYISSYVPRKCGIATFTRDLTSAINLINPDSIASIAAMTRLKEGIKYPPEVKFKISQNNLESYLKAAEKINKSKIEIVSLQHEFGLFGGPYGSYILEFIKNLKKPLVITTHTVPDNPEKDYGLMLKEIIKYPQKIIVMMPESLIKLVKKYNCPAEKIEIIPHGVPDIPLEPTHKHKRKKLLQDRFILGNINLLSESKGLEYTLQAIAKVKSKIPNVLYLIIGQTHPVVLKEVGERYRNSLKEMIKDLDIEDNVRFINKYITLEELVDWLKVIDIYITPYLDPQQSASGALAYAIGAGKVCISTPYLYAKEVLAESRGILVPFRNSGAIASAIMQIYENPEKKAAIEKKSYQYGRFMTWSNVALHHLDLFNKVLDQNANYKIIDEAKNNQRNIKDFVLLKKIRLLTSETGIYQHGKLGFADPFFGYAIEDQARALIVAEESGEHRLSNIYLDFVKKASEKSGLPAHFYYEDTNEFSEFEKRKTDLSKDGSVIINPNIQEAYGTVLWALLSTDKKDKNVEAIVEKIKVDSAAWTSPRAASLALLGLAKASKPGSTEENLKNKLFDLFKQNASAKWMWFENYLTYANALMPWALWEIYLKRNCSKSFEIAKKSTDFLLRKCQVKGIPAPIGNKGWHKKYAKKSLYDQQPVDAAYMVCMLEKAYAATSDLKYSTWACKWFNWFWGYNINTTSLIEKNGACYDALTASGKNLNQGAESNICFVMACNAAIRMKIFEI